jgi:transcriptional regulator with XRE-family HTH domain
VNLALTDGRPGEVVREGSPRDLTIGQRVARCRRRKGISQEVLAHLLGKSKSWLTKVERGERQLDRMSVVLEIARVLEVDTAEITGGSRWPGAEPAHPAVPAIRRVLMCSSVERVEATRADGVDSLPVLERRLREANRLRHGADYERSAASCPHFWRTCKRPRSPSGTGSASARGGWSWTPATVPGRC